MCINANILHRYALQVYNGETSVSASQVTRRDMFFESVLLSRMRYVAQISQMDFLGGCPQDDVKLIICFQVSSTATIFNPKASVTVPTFR